MTFEEALVDYLEAVTPVAAIFGTNVYPLRLPDPPPSIGLVYQRISTVRESAHDGRLPDGESRWQLDVWSRRYLDVREGARAVTAALLGFTGTMGDIQVSIPRQPRDQDDYEPETRLYRAILEFTIWHTEGATS